MAELMAEMLAEVLLVFWETAAWLYGLLSRAESRKRPTVWMIGCLGSMATFVLVAFGCVLGKIDPFGQQKPISAAFIFERSQQPQISEQAGSLAITFDRADVSWLRGYCHFLAAMGELCLAVDGQHAFECTAHLFFEDVETPHSYLLQSRRTFDQNPLANRATVSDAISFFHQLTRLPIKEPARMKAALGHIEAGLGQAKELWKFVLAETDDENEWIPSPKQKAAIGVNVTQEMVDAWLQTLDEVEQVIQGKKLVPFWRGEMGGRGVNIRRAFVEPQPTFDVIEWVQGPAAAPYLEEGPLTKLADPQVGTRLNNAFGGPLNFVGFGFWFN